MFVKPPLDRVSNDEHQQDENGGQENLGHEVHKSSQVFPVSREIIIPALHAPVTSARVPRHTDEPVLFIQIALITKDLASALLGNFADVEHHVSECTAATCMARRPHGSGQRTGWDIRTAGTERARERAKARLRPATR